MNIPVEKPTVIIDGVHNGVIIAVNYRTNPYKYTDYVIEFLQDTEKYQLKCGFPTKLYENSKHGAMLKSFGVVVQEGLECDPDSLIGRAVSFQTLTKGKFADIVPESLKPLAAQPSTEQVIHQQAEKILTDEEKKASFGQ